MEPDGGNLLWTAKDVMGMEFSIIGNKIQGPGCHTSHYYVAAS